MKEENRIKQLSLDRIACQKILIAMGDADRLHLILEMMKMGNCSVIRVGEITKHTNLSRPAVFHHFQILKDAGIIKVRKEGTKNFYYFDADKNALDLLI